MRYALRVLWYLNYRSVVGRKQLPVKVRCCCKQHLRGRVIRCSSPQGIPSMRRTLLLIAMHALMLVHPLAIGQQQNVTNEKQRDDMGREVIRGPVGSGYYDNVRIISDSVGIQGDSVTVTNSVIEAPVCVRTSGLGTTLRNNILMCNLCIEFTDSVLINNTLIDNHCSGQGTNRPDVFGW